MKFTAAELTVLRDAFRRSIATAPAAKRAARPRPRAVPGPTGHLEYEDGDILTTRQVADVFGVSTQIVRRRAEAGILPSFRTLGGHRRFRWADVMRWLNRAGDEVPTA
jgi:excisionase family DNA binding protein